MRVRPCFLLLPLLLWGCSGQPAPVDAEPDPGAALSADLAGEWRGWGGPNGDFRLEARKLADEWPAWADRVAA